jgi:hypothetical protein
MADDYRSKVQGAQSGFEKLVGSIPGYKGYKERELRREADKLLRMHIAGLLDVQRQRLVTLTATLTNAGRYSELVALERAQQKLQLFIDRLRTASYGYAGLFDAVKVQQTQLDALYEFDNQLVASTSSVGDVLTALETLASKGETTATDANALLNLLQSFNDTFSHRQEVMGK